ncbi:unnamed protein product, partial [Arabidopsis halleri]
MPRIDGPFKITKKINNNAYQLDLQGKYNVSSSFNVSDLAPFLADEADLRTNPFQEREDDVILNRLDHTPTTDSIKLEEKLGPEQLEEVLKLSKGPMTRSRTKKLAGAIGGLLKQVESSSNGFNQ